MPASCSTGFATPERTAQLLLRDHPGSRVADLAAEFAIGIGATSKGVDRLDKKAWVIRRPTRRIVAHHCWN
ncbi:MarR family transcriptional regulator [Streptomyces decoyicus]|uniref:MarR family transcriptional regulator n=1 Tax=Streptomyces decoyicus TaxID=249567 RepID=UPI00364FFC47